MLIIDEYFNKKIEKNTYIALGSFDGLHLGHMSLINKSIELAKENKGYSMVYTFKNHPKTVVKGATPPKLLTSNEYKLKLLENSGVDVACLVTFDEEYMKITAEEFIKLLIKTYNAKGFVVGFNYKFGYRNTGDVELLRKLQNKYGYDLVIMDPLKYNDEIVSSSVIRKEISTGNIEKASLLLNRPYCLINTVIEGKKLGRKIGYPTANLKVDNKYVIPAVGVYYTNIQIDNVVYKGITSVGTNPTVEGKDFSIETYILDYNEDIYGREVYLYFIKRIRDESKFNSLDELVSRIDLDRKFAEEEKLHAVFLKK
ncbi:bifunctional riboflavin kinase/FAD synthetase [Clostridium polynesiense]|uniref:bifunctional riboflavin kinase/FAD synthetase n=1 Tax=Clostridium polynesiense TaxID=1325933 RepID=UPI00058E6689|nr:bifunctional riboflavin kinase/FAD synthetase [Clostridium polynesiense]